MCDSKENSKKKTLDNLEVGDIVHTKSGSKYEILAVTPTSVILAEIKEGQTTHRYSIHEMKDKNWIIDKPLSKTEKGAKKMLELAGFKVTR